jgi:hypothetical protein
MGGRLPLMSHVHKFMRAQAANAQGAAPLQLYCWKQLKSDQNIARQGHGRLKKTGEDHVARLPRAGRVEHRTAADYGSSFYGFYCRRIGNPGAATACA